MSIVDDFKKFISEQPKDKGINHYTFTTCATGAFIRASDVDNFRKGLDELLHALRTDDISLYNTLNSAYGSSLPDVSTYGKLHSVIQKRKPVTMVRKVVRKVFGRFYE